MPFKAYWLRDTPPVEHSTIISSVHNVFMPFKAYWLRDAPPVEHSTIVRSAHDVFMCFVFIREQTATCAIYSIN